MTRAPKAALAAILALAIAGCALARRSGAPEGEASAAPLEPAAAAPEAPPPRGPSYETLLKQLRAGDADIDFTALRLAYAASPAYTPYDTDVAENRHAMYEAVADGDHQQALARARTILERVYVDADAHLGAAFSYREMGDAARADFHDAVARGLLDSVGGAADGKDPDHAIVVISSAEENSYLTALGYEFRKQTLVACADGPCDEVEVLDRATGRTLTLYFNVALPMRRLGGSVGE